MSVRRAGLGLGAALALVVVGVGTGTAQTPQPLSFGLFPFPGAAGAPVSGTSAGVALADRWLADEPSGNPAVAAGFHVTASPTVLRVNRQDLASHNRSYSETGAF
ncbi:MAG: hypothetical protein HY076_03970, partial [Candidatus Eisenbacteria bacterium]|nr:hypothetical protein [Candidatus Eisenbacteria bacterium]